MRLNRHRIRTSPFIGSARLVLLILAAWMALLSPVLTRVAMAADIDWTGSWDTKWRGGGARLDLKQSGGHVTGHYALYGGDVDAVASGRELNGRWMAGPRSGSFVFTMGPDGRTFAGRYDNGEWWTAARSTPPFRPVRSIDPMSARRSAPSSRAATSPARAASRSSGRPPPCST